MSLVELLVAIVVGAILICVTCGMVITVLKFYYLTRDEMAKSHSWIVANAHLEKYIRNSSYVRIGDLLNPGNNQFLSLYDIENVPDLPKSVYRNTGSGLTFSEFEGSPPQEKLKMTFEGVNAVFENPYPPRQNLTEVKIEFSRPWSSISHAVCRQSKKYSFGWLIPVNDPNGDIWQDAALSSISRIAPLDADKDIALMGSTVYSPQRRGVFGRLSGITGLFKNIFVHRTMYSPWRTHFMFGRKSPYSNAFNIGGFIGGFTAFFQLNHDTGPLTISKPKIVGETVYSGWWDVCITDVVEGPDNYYLAGQKRFGYPTGVETDAVFYQLNKGNPNWSVLSSYKYGDRGNILKNDGAGAYNEGWPAMLNKPSDDSYILMATNVTFPNTLPGNDPICNSYYMKLQTSGAPMWNRLIGTDHDTNNSLLRINTGVATGTFGACMKKTDATGNTYPCYARLDSSNGTVTEDELLNSRYYKYNGLTPNAGDKIVMTGPVAISDDELIAVGINQTENQLYLTSFNADGVLNWFSRINGDPEHITFQEVKFVSRAEDPDGNICYLILVLGHVGGANVYWYGRTTSEGDAFESTGAEQTNPPTEPHSGKTTVFAPYIVEILNTLETRYPSADKTPPPDPTDVTVNTGT